MTTHGQEMWRTGAAVASAVPDGLRTFLGVCLPQRLQSAAQPSSMNATLSSRIEVTGATHPCHALTQRRNLVRVSRTGAHRAGDCGATLRSHAGAVHAGNGLVRSLRLAGGPAAYGAGVGGCRAFSLSAWSGAQRAAAGDRIPPGGGGQWPQHTGLRSRAAGRSIDAGRCQGGRRSATAA